MQFKLKPGRQEMAYALAASLFATAKAFAQEAPADTAAEAATAGAPSTVAAPSSVLSRVTVTAQKREENIQEVPIPIKAVDGDEILDKQITLSTDVERLAPNLSAQGGGRTGKPRWFLRGIGTNDPNQNQDGPLSIYVDEVVVGLQKLQSFPLYDLERVEVLRGPQGTLWGKNNTGGALHFISRKPSFDQDGYTTLGVGNYGTRTAEAAYGGPVVDDLLAARTSVYYERSSGYASNILSGDKGPNLSDFNGRFQLLGTFTENFDAQLIVSTRQVDTGNTPSYVVGGVRPVYTLPDGSPNPDADVTTPSDTITTGGGSFRPPYGSKPDIYSDFWGGDGYNKSNRNSGTLKLNYQLGSLTVSSITGYADSDTQTLSLVGVPLDSTLNRTSSVGNDSSQQWSQELRLTSPRNERLSWILGAYWYQLDADNYARSARFPAGSTGKQYSESSWDQTSESQALFGNLRFNFTERASIAVGARVTKEKKDVVETTRTVNGNAVTFVSENAWFLPGGTTFASTAPGVTSDDGNKDWTRFTWDVTPEYRFTDDLFGYLRVATGFRSGGFNASLVSGKVVVTDQETLTDYEAGLKSSWFGGRLTVNPAVFYYDIKNLQLNIQRAYQDPVTTTFTTSTAGQSDGNIYGAEVEFDALLTEYWRFGGSLGLLRSEYTDFKYRIGNSAQFDASGNEFYRTPRTQARLFTDYTIPLGLYEVVLSTDWSYRSHIYHNATVQNDPVQETPGFWTGNAQASFGIRDHWRLAAYIRNLTDENPYYLAQIYNPNSGTYPVSFGDPQTYGVQLTVNF